MPNSSPAFSWLLFLVAFFLTRTAQARSQNAPNASKLVHTKAPFWFTSPQIKAGLWVTASFLALLVYAAIYKRMRFPKNHGLKGVKRKLSFGSEPSETLFLESLLPKEPLLDLPAIGNHHLFKNHQEALAGHKGYLSPTPSDHRFNSLCREHPPNHNTGSTKQRNNDG